MSGGRTSFTYRFPGDFRFTYTGTPKPLWRWIALTWVPGLILWRIWITEALFFMATGRVPYPKQVSAVILGDIKRVIEQIREEAYR